MNKDTQYSLVAVGFLVIAIVSLVFVRAKLMADSNLPQGKVRGIQDVRLNNVPLKVGWNYFLNTDFAVNGQSSIILVHGRLISIDEALSGGFISRVAAENTGKILHKDVENIPIGQGFEIYVLNIDNNQMVVLP